MKKSSIKKTGNKNGEGGEESEIMNGEKLMK
jgi:hypothetical protein